MPLPPRPSPPSPWLVSLRLVLKVVWVAFVVATPVLGVWVASSLAAYLDGPVSLALAMGILLFPAIPLTWEAWASHRRRVSPRGAVKPRLLTFGDRFILRALAVNLLFLGLLLTSRPAVAFAALSTRGDWMLEGRHGRREEQIRRALFAAADRLEWIYLAVHKNPFEDPGGRTQPGPNASALPSGAPDPTTTAAPANPTPAPSSSTSPSTSTHEPAPKDTAPVAWPSAAELHKVVREMPASAEGSIGEVARYIRDRESDPMRLVKALHDYVADRIAYDAPAYAANQYPPQDAETVFRTRKAVCAGYAALLVALGKAAGADIRFVPGDARRQGSDETGAGHAWNAAQIGGRFYLIDATWDAGFVTGAQFEKKYRTEYLFTPPEVIGLSHFPEEPRWQLREPPITRGDFFRQPMMQPSFYAEERVLVSPTRSQVSVRSAIEVVLKNPEHLATLADFVAAGATKGTPCEVWGLDTVSVRCVFPAPGRWEVRLFSSADERGVYHFIGQVDANDER